MYNADEVEQLGRSTELGDRMIHDSFPTDVEGGQELTAALQESVIDCRALLNEPVK